MSDTALDRAIYWAKKADALGDYPQREAEYLRRAEVWAQVAQADALARIGTHQIGDVRNLTDLSKERE